MNYNEIYNSSLKKEDLQDGDGMVLTVASWRVKQFEDGEEKIALGFEEESKELILNKVNAQTIAEIANSFSTDDWLGHRVHLYFEPDVMMGSRKTGGIRVRRPDTASLEAAEAELPV